MRASGRRVPELGLNRLDRVAAGGGLAGHRMAAHPVVTGFPQAEGSLHGPQGQCMGVDARGEAPVLAEQEPRAGVLFPDVPANGVDHVLGEGKGQHLVVLARPERGRALLVPTLHRSVDDELRGNVPDSVPRDGVDFARAKTEPRGELEERVPLRVHLEHACEQPVALLFGVPLSG